MSEIFTNSNFLLVAQLIAIGIFIKLVVFPLIENLNLNTKEKTVAATIPLTEIFLEYNHANPEAWYTWICKEKTHKQNQAFQKLVQYFDIPVELFKPVLNDAIRIITAFKKPGTETAIFKLLQRISLPNPPSEYYDYYAKALKSLIELNAERAANFLDGEYRKHHKNPEYVKRFVFASKFFPSNRLPLKLLSNYLLNTEYLINDRLGLLESMKEKPDNFYEIAITILEKLLDNKDIDPLITEYSYINLLKLDKINQKEFSKSLKIFFNKTWVSDHLFSILKTHLITDPSSILNPISLANIIKSINPLNHDSLTDLLSEKYNISDKEIELIQEVELIEKFKKNSKLSLEKTINILDPSHDELPDFLTEQYHDFKDYAFNNKYDAFKMIYGDNEEEKFLLIKKLAQEENKKILVISIDKLIEDQTMLDNLETHLKTILNKILYIPGFEALIKELASKEDTTNIHRKILNRFKFLVLKSNIPILVSCKKEALEAKAKEFLNNEKEIPKQEFELMNFDQKERLRIINESLASLNQERNETQKKSIATELYQKTQNKSSLNFKHYIFDYFRLSLLSQGKLFTDAEYQVILDSIEEEVSIKELVAKVNLQR